MRSLDDLSCHDEGVIKKVGGEGALRRRMIDMGITVGAKVKTVRRAPAGDPIEISIHGYNLSIRKSEAREIELFENDEEFQNYKNGISKNFGDLGRSFLNIPPFKCAKSSSGYFRAALIGNPNSGKTTLFNQLTGSYQYVGNWPGVTVARKEGRIKNITDKINLIDLPGVYSLSPYSPEEVVTRNYIMEEMPDVIINIIDSTNLERNLYLTTQILELDCKVILALNMSDLLLRRGKVIDYKELEKQLGVPVVPISAGKNKDLDKLLEVLSLLVKKDKNIRTSRRVYSHDVENALENISKCLNSEKNYVYNNRFKTVKIFEGDDIILSEYALDAHKINLISKIKSLAAKSYGKQEDAIIADERYAYIYGVCQKAVKKTNEKKNISVSNYLDKFVLGKYTAFPCFAIFVMLIFYITFGPVGITLKNYCEKFINVNMHGTIEKILNYTKAAAWSKSLVLDAVIGGVGAVVSFLPQIVLLFTLLSLLEDCGYMARAAFVMDKPLRKIGLSGKAFVPLIMGFGCSVPAIMGTKILESKKDKNLAMFLIPFMSCSAKMPVYLLFASVFFPGFQMLVIFSLYIIGVLCALLTAYIFKDSVFKGGTSPFIMEIPEYKWPSLKNVRLNVWDKTKDFVERAGTVILLATILVWFLQYFGTDFKYAVNKSESILAFIGSFIAPVFKPCGFAGWEASVSLITGLMAKESVVSTFSVLYGGAYSSLQDALSKVFGTASAISFMVFVLLYTPCIAAVSALYKEYQDKKMAIFSVCYQMVFAYVVSALIYQIITLLGKIL